MHSAAPVQLAAELIDLPSVTAPAEVPQTEDILRLYEGELTPSDRDALERLLQENPALAPALVELKDALTAAFGPDVPARLEVFTDPEDGSESVEVLLRLPRGLTEQTRQAFNTVTEFFFLAPNHQAVLGWLTLHLDYPLPSHV